jgi:hypothetical protein
MIYLKRTILLAVLFLAFAEIGFSCSCLQITHKGEIKLTDIIFVGEVVEIIRDASYVPPKIKNISASLQKRVDSRRRYLVKFKIERGFKGISSKFTTLAKYEQEDAPCEGMLFTQGSKYLIYANNYEGEVQGNGLCSRTQNLDKESKDYKELLVKFPLKSKKSILKS